MSEYQPCCAECNGCPVCDPGLAPMTAPTVLGDAAEVASESGGTL